MGDVGGGDDGWQLMLGDAFGMLPLLLLCVDGVLMGWLLVPSTCAACDEIHLVAVAHVCSLIWLCAIRN